MRKLLILLSGIIVFSSCEKGLLDDNPNNDPQTNFDILWKTVDEKYSFFDLKRINWDSVRTRYEPMIHSNMSDEDLFAIMDTMLFALRDGHVNLASPFNVNRNWSWYLNFPVNFNYDVVERNYLKSDHRIAGGIKYTIIDSIGYMYYGSFSSGFSIDNLKAVTSYFKGTKGVIVDVRGNGGGSLNNALALTQVFANESKQAIVSFEKTGPGHNDFGNGLTYTLGPLDQAHYDGPVAVLINRSCYSATNFFAAAMSNYSNVTLIGDRTGGGGGIPVDFELPNGWRFRFSATATFLPTGFNIEVGIPPNVPGLNDPAVNANGTDQILERALLYLN